MKVALFNEGEGFPGQLKLRRLHHAEQGVDIDEVFRATGKDLEGQKMAGAGNRNQQIRYDLKKIR